jgi:hypothetical protein
MRKILLASIATLGAGLAFTNAAHAQPVKPVAPGAITVHLNGYLMFNFNDEGSTDNVVGTAKLNPVTTTGDARIYSGVDAATLSGINYGAQIELRTTTSDAGVAAGKTSGTGSTAGTEGIYVKRAYGYLGTTTGGYIRFGQGDSAFTLDQTGVIEAFGDGQQYNGDGSPDTVVPTDAVPSSFIYADSSGLYATSKIVYLSPVIAGFSAAVGYEPNSNGLKEGYGNDAAASSNNGATAPSLTAANVAASADAGNIGKQRKNTIDAALLYTLKADGFVTKANIGIIHGAPIAYDGAKVATGALHYGYDDLNVFQAGAQTTVAGFTVGANVKTGATEDGYAFKVRGTRDGTAFIVGGNYVIGPYVIGASYFDNQTAGAYTPGSALGHTLNEYGAAVGGNYVVGKDLSLFAQYLYGHRHQHGNAALDLNNTVKGTSQDQVISVGALLKW